MAVAGGAHGTVIDDVGHGIRKHIAVVGKAACGQHHGLCLNGIGGAVRRRGLNANHGAVRRYQLFRLGLQHESDVLVFVDALAQRLHQRRARSHGNIITIGLVVHLGAGQCHTVGKQPVDHLTGMIGIQARQSFVVLLMAIFH